MLCRRPAFAAAALVSLTLLLGTFPTGLRADEVKPDPTLTRQIAAVRDAHKVPALWAGLVEGEALVAVAAVGVRKVGADDSVTAADRVHIGSDTKAMTATLLAVLIEQKKLSWSSTIGDVLPDLKGKIHDDYLGVTVAQLLAHEGGVVPNVLWWGTDRDKPVRDQRAALLPMILKNAPADKPGTKFVYSNASYVVAGAMAEAVADASWEELMRERLFKPLGLASAGFGSPGKKGGTEQPWGHKPAKDGFEPTQFDNAPVIGPAGTVHLSLPDWAKFASAHLRGAQGKGTFLKPETFAKLHTPAEGFRYAGGWGVNKDGNLSHDGSNSFWYSRVRLMPKQNVAFLVVTNAGGDEAQKAVAAAEKVLIEYARERAAKK
ncbi:beta-lactamase family protein [Gemmata sp. JC673]|uniref:Beta-lactamase family protein n=1 Tax=Gemmata algarum TaxID=2975278 RepID=A0ABU5EVZ4_9BACT|nr:serine hydrolase [Gemmata algarum]MDY3559404.1 beta-lactamase family protein [Gemmata algarum]